MGIKKGILMTKLSNLITLIFIKIIDEMDGCLFNQNHQTAPLGSGIVLKISVSL